MNLQTTLNIIRASSPCADGWAKLLKSLPKDHDHDTPIPFSHILESNGLNNSLWALRCVLPEQEKERDVEARLLACDFAENVLRIFEAKYPNDQRPRECLEVARRFANGSATKVQLAASRYAARYASNDAASDAARAAADAARAAAAAAWDAAWDAAGAAADAALLAAKSDAESIQRAQFIVRFCTQEVSK